MNTLKSDRLLPEYYIEVVVAIIVLGYCFIRANGISMTHDESATILDYVQLPLIDILTNTPPSANNHILNTLLVKGLIAIKNSPLIIRLPNVLALLFYLFYASRLSNKLLTSSSSRILSFIILILNPYVLDFFSLARGYGLSLGFLMGSLYYFYEYTKEWNHRKLAYSIAFAVFGVWSNLTMLHYYLALIALVILMVLLQKQALKTTFRTLTISTLILTLLIYFPINGLIKAHELYFGGQSGFYTDTFQSLVKNSLYSQSHFGEHTIAIVKLTCLIITLLAASNGIWRYYRERYFSNTLLWSSLLFIMIMGNVLQFYLFNTRYLIDRTALIYWPIFALLWGSFLGGVLPETWQKIKSIKWLIIGIRWLIVIGLFIHFYQCMNFIKAREWWYDRHTKGMIEYVLRHNPENDTLRLGAKWIFKPTINYYILSRNYDFIKGPGQGRGGLDTTDYYDYYYIEPSDQSQINPIYEIDTIMGSGNWLMKKRQ